MKILITGANGNLGREIVRQMQNESIKAGVRNIDKSQKTDGVAYVTLDYDKPETFSSALEGVSKVLLTAPPLDAEAAERLTPFIQTLQEKGIKRVALLSALGMDHSDETPLRKIELQLIQGNFEYTIIRPNFFSENFTTGFAAGMLQEKGVLVHSAGDGKTSFISTEDIASVFQKVLTTGGHEQKEYNLTGPEALTYAEAASLLSGYYNKEIHQVALSPEEMKAGAMESGMPESAADYLLGLYDATANGALAITNDTVEKLLNRPAKTLADVLQK